MIKIIIITVICLLVIFIIYRYIASILATQKRDKMIVNAIKPIVTQIENNESLDLSTVKQLADDPSTRGTLYLLLDSKNRLELFPEKFKNLESAAESLLVFWLLHPNELGSKPSELKLGHIITKFNDTDKVDYKFYLYKFKWHISEKDQQEKWVAGVAGPFRNDEDPYKQGTTFSTFGFYDELTPDQHVDWFINNILSRYQ